MKVFSPEIVLIVLGQAIRAVETSINMCVKGKCILAYRDFNPQRANERIISELGRTISFLTEALHNSKKGECKVWRYGSRTDS